MDLELEFKYIISTLINLFQLEKKLNIYALLSNSNIQIEESGFDNWNGGIYLYSLYIYTDVRMFLDIKDKIDDISNRILEYAHSSSQHLQSIRIVEVKIIPRVERVTIMNRSLVIAESFLTHTSNILGHTDNGLTGSEIVRFFNGYSVDFNIEIPYSHYPFPDYMSKKVAFLKNLEAFEPKYQYYIIKELCSIEKFKSNKDAVDLKTKLILRYGDLDQNSEKVNELLIDETKHWLSNYPDPLSNYNSALDKYKSKIFERNCLDDLRLSLELLLKSIFMNEKSLENQISDIGTFIKDKKGSKEFSNMFSKLIEYYTKYQNTYVKHYDNVIEEEIEFILELTSSFMKHLVRLNS
jgi:hypothetical protein